MDVVVVERPPIGSAGSGRHTPSSDAHLTCTIAHNSQFSKLFFYTNTTCISNLVLDHLTMKAVNMHTAFSLGFPTS